MKEYLKGRCPICKGQLFVNQFGYQCEDCSFTIPKFICNRNITIYEAEKILQGERIILDGFSKRDGKVFSSIPVVRDSSISLDNTISQCPQLGGGRIYVDAKYFRCSLHGTCSKHCCFANIPGVRRCYNGHLITVEEILRLILHKVISFKFRDADGLESEKSISIHGTKMKVV